MSVDLDQVRKALEAATPGHWEHDTHEQVVRAEDYRIVHDYSTVIWDAPEDVPQAERDAYLIANAPAWLAQLVSEVDSLRSQLAKERGPLPEGWNLEYSRRVWVNFQPDPDQ